MAWKSKERSAAWAKKNREKVRLSTKNSLNKLKDKVFSLYGSMCSCCGETGKSFLTVDHINGDGYKDKKIFRGLYSKYKKIVEDKDQTKYQILCWNCNCAKRSNKTCPHQHETVIDKYINSLGG